MDYVVRISKQFRIRIFKNYFRGDPGSAGTYTSRNLPFEATIATNHCAYSHVTTSINIPFAFGHLIYSVGDDPTAIAIAANDTILV